MKKCANLHIEIAHFTKILISYINKSGGDPDEKYKIYYQIK